jgi:hypothetical protein
MRAESAASADLRAAISALSAEFVAYDGADTTFATSAGAIVKPIRNAATATAIRRRIMASGSFASRG